MTLMQSTAAAPSAPAPAKPAGLSRIAFDDPEFDGQFVRALDAVFDGGADIGECFATARAITPGDKDGWLTQWQATADRVYAGAEESLAEGHRVSAYEAYLRAVTYYRTSGVLLYARPLDPRFVDSYRKQREAFQKAAALSPYSVEVVRVPYEGSTLEGYFATPVGARPFPTMIIVGGYDGTKEECYFSGGLAALRRGYAILLVDGPGQGGALIEQGLVFRHDWEAVITPQIDWLLDRSDVDPARIVMMGRSWGGFLAPRAATAEHRVAAVVADAAQYTPGTNASALLPAAYRDDFAAGDPGPLNAVLEQEMSQVPAIAFMLNRGMLTHGFDTPLGYLRGSAPYTLAGLADKITCPIMICVGENDVRGSDGKNLYDAIVAPKKYIQFTNVEGAGEHDEAGAASLFARRVYDWLDETLATI